MYYRSEQEDDYVRNHHNHYDSRNKYRKQYGYYAVTHNKNHGGHTAPYDFLAYVTVIATFAVMVANAFAAAPCIGAYYEPELPEELRK